MQEQYPHRKYAGEHTVSNRKRRSLSSVSEVYSDGTRSLCEFSKTVLSSG